VKSRTTAAFRKAFRGLPDRVKREATVAYDRFRIDPWHPSLKFKKVHSTQPIFSVRIGRAYRAIGIREGDEIIWYWIGSHADYDTLIS